jgi:hypothetical protein
MDLKFNEARRASLNLSLTGSMDPFASNGRSLDTDLLIFRSLFALDPVTSLPVSTNYILSSDGRGGLNWQDIFTNMSSLSATIGAGVGYLPSTLSDLSGSIVNINTTIANSAIAGSLNGPQLFSTVNGLGTGSYISSLQLQSTVRGLGTTGYISSSQLTSTTTGFQAFIAATTTALYNASAETSHNNLASVGYVSSSQLTSTTRGFGTAGYISSSQFASTIRNLGTTGYVSSLSLISSVVGQNLSLRSTLAGLGTYGYVSSSQLLSTSASLLRTVNINTAGSLTIYNAVVNISTLGNIAYLPSFLNSSITYKGTNGLTTAINLNNDLFFSSANLQLKNFSSFILPSTQITADIYPNLFFCSLYDPNSINNTMFIQLSSYLTYAGTPLLNTTNNSIMVGSSFSPHTSNTFQTPIRMSFKGCNVYQSFPTPQYDQEYVLMHRLVNGASSYLSPGFQNSNVQIYMASTNSVFLTMQNSFS